MTKVNEDDITNPSAKTKTEEDEDDSPNPSAIAKTEEDEENILNPSTRQWRMKTSPTLQ